MKTAVSIPDAVYREADKAAKRLGVSRSELYTRALREYLSTIETTWVKRSYDQAFGYSKDDDDDAVRVAGRKTLLDVEW